MSPGHLRVPGSSPGSPTTTMNKDLLNRTDHEGAKGPIFFGKDELLVYLRDDKTDYFPGFYDLPGGGKEDNETVFETFSRETKEEFRLDVSHEQIRFVRRYPHTRFPGELAYFIVAELPQEDKNKIKFGLEGTSY